MLSMDIQRLLQRLTEFYAVVVPSKLHNTHNLLHWDLSLSAYSIPSTRRQILDCHCSCQGSVIPFTNIPVNFLFRSCLFRQLADFEFCIKMLWRLQLNFGLTYCIILICIPYSRFHLCPCFIKQINKTIKMKVTRAFYKTFCHKTTFGFKHIYKQL